LTNSVTEDIVGQVNLKLWKLDSAVADHNEELGITRLRQQHQWLEDHLVLQVFHKLLTAVAAFEALLAIVDVTIFDSAF